MLAPETARNDIFRRFTPTPLELDFAIMGRPIRVETNSSSVSAHVQNVTRSYATTERLHPQFLWRIVSDASSGLFPPLSRRIGFSDGSLRFVNLNQRAFLAIDLDAHEATAFLSPELCEDEMGFYSVVLSDLFDLSSAMLGLTEIMAGLVAANGRGLLVFGSPRSGKTTSCYWAGKMGMELHGDQVTCLEVVSGELRGWGQLWPVAFRPETQEFLPEIQRLTRPMRYRDLNLLCLDHRIFLPAEASSVLPVACVFLERCAADVPQLKQIDKEELTALVTRSLPFVENRRFDHQRREVIRHLAGLPAYHLPYPADPRTAAELFPSLLAG